MTLHDPSRDPSSTIHTSNETAAAVQVSRMRSASSRSDSSSSYTGTTIDKSTSLCTCSAGEVGLDGMDRVRFQRASADRASGVDRGVACVALDELAPWLNGIAHECAENAIGRRGIVDGHLLQAPRRGVHGSLPQLLGVHLTETFITLDDRLGAAHISHFDQDFLKLLLGPRVALILTHLHLVERREYQIKIETRNVSLWGSVSN